MADPDITAERLLVGADLYDTNPAQLPALYREREEFYRSVLDSLEDGVIITDGDDRILYVNARLRDISGYAPEELIGRIGYEVLAPRKDWSRMRERLTERLSGVGEHYDIELLRKDGRITWIEVAAKPYRDASGVIRGTVGTVSCIDRRKSLEHENEYLRDVLRGAESTSGLIGPSTALARVREQIAMVAPTMANVLVYGESGTGKELVAAAIHEASSRHAKPLVRVNCAAIPKDLFESEFFGHVRGAFTGAVKDRIGRFELAHGGTLFLDEIGEIPHELQGKLLRVIQEGTFERIGEERTRRVDVRLISATNRNLMREAAEGRFRQDLYYRLSVFPIEIPPLRERRDDIIPLAEHFLRLAAKKFHHRVPALTKAQVRELEQYDWPGNVRELQNVMDRAAILASRGAFSLHLDQRLGGSPSPVKLPRARGTGGAYAEDLALEEKGRITAAMREARGKIYGPNGAAALLGLKPTTLASKLARFGLKRTDFLHG
ncbi:MAG: sigma 54-interacting transcriptional regulator [Bryobacterales bacterium]|nr:sigma 54-interacting transcriptional regulator [Bryobacterales bacterium]